MKDIGKQYKIAFGTGVIISSWIWYILFLLVLIDLKYLEGQIIYPKLDIILFGMIIQFCLQFVFSIITYILAKYS